MKKLYFLISFFSIFCINGQNSADRDPTFNTFSLPIGSYYIDQNVKKTVVQSDNKILLLKVNRTSGRAELFRMINNLLDSSFNTGSGFNSDIFDFIVQPDGKILVLGNFTSYNQKSVDKIVRLNSDGSLDNSFVLSKEPNIHGNNSFTSEILLQPDGKILLTAMLNTKIAVVRLNINGSLDTTFTSGALFERSPGKMALQPDGKIVISGITSGTTGYAEMKIVRLNSDGSLETNITPLIKKTNGIYKIISQSDGKILVAAWYISSNNYISAQLIRLNSDCTPDVTFAANVVDVATSEGIRDIVLDPEGKIILVGDFYRFNNITYGGIIRLNSDGTKDITFDIAGGEKINTVSLFADGRMVVAGDFTSFNRTKLHNITVLFKNGLIDPSFNNIRVGFDTSSTIVLAVLPNDKILVGVYGSIYPFNAYNGIQNKGLVLLNSDGSQDNSLTFGVRGPFDYGGIPSCAAVQKDGKILFGGDFTGFFFTTTNRIARMNADGTRDNTFVMGTGFDQLVKKIVVLEDDKILVGGSFTTYKNKGTGILVRLNSDGSVDPDFDTTWLKSLIGRQILVDNFVNLPDGKILVSAIGYKNNYGILRLNSNGTQDTSFTLDQQIASYGSEIMVQKDGRILTTAKVGTAYVVVRLFADGGLDTSFNYGLDTNNMIPRLAGMQLDDKLIVTGYNYTNTKNKFFARLNLDGSMDESFHNLLNNNEIDYFSNLVPQSNGKLIYYGIFENYRGVPAGGFIRLLGQDFKFVQGENKLDTDHNGCDVADIPFKSLKLNIKSGADVSSLITNTTGNYTITMLKGSHTITPVFENPSYFTVSPASHTVDFSTEASPRKADFCITPNGDNPDLEVTILPLSPARPGFDAQYKIVYTNTGNKQLSASLSFNFDDTRIDLVQSYPNFSSQLPNNLKWDITNLNPLETREISVVLNVNSPMENPAVQGGDILKYEAEISSSQADETPGNNKFVFDQVVVNSFDPNDKTCVEGAEISQTKVGDYVHYIIRFENTGTYAAQNITVKDVIDTSKYDISSLYPLTGSHLFSTEISENNKVSFKFENINLPFNDADNDGYVAFKIKTKSTLTSGDTFGDSANIYFDYNSAITTNVPTTKISETLGTKDFAFEKYFVLYPNPGDSILNIAVKEDVSVSSIQVYNIVGQLILVIPNPKNTEIIDISSLNSGNYFIRMVTDKGTSNARFLKR